MILVYAENSEGQFKKSALEAVSYGAKMATDSNTSCVVLSLGMVNDSVAGELAKNGADKIISIQNEGLNTFNAQLFANTIAETAISETANILVISNTYTGKSVAPRIAAKLKASIVSGVISYPDTSSGFKVRKTVFSGKAFADVQMNSGVKVISITPNTFTLYDSPKPVNIEQRQMNISAGEGTQSIEIQKAKGKVVLTEASVVVSGGRGLKGPENWGLIENLAEILGAATACSKPVADMDWRPHNEHVGQTGITIKPDLYVAIGISGAIQHLAGVSSSKVIVVINKDAEAPFFKSADYGIVGDAFEVLPKITEAARKLKAAHS